MQGKWLMTCSAAGWGVLRSAAGEKRWVREVLPARTLCASPDGSTYVSFKASGTVRWTKNLLFEHEQRFATIRVQSGQGFLKIVVYKPAVCPSGARLYWQLRSAQDYVLNFVRSSLTLFAEYMCYVSCFFCLVMAYLDVCPPSPLLLSPPSSCVVVLCDLLTAGLPGAHDQRSLHGALDFLAMGKVHGLRAPVWLRLVAWPRLCRQCSPALVGRAHLPRVCGQHCSDVGLAGEVGLDAQRSQRCEGSRADGWSPRHVRPWGPTARACAVAHGRAHAALARLAVTHCGVGASAGATPAGPTPGCEPCCSPCWHEEPRVTKWVSVCGLECMGNGQPSSRLQD